MVIAGMSASVVSGNNKQLQRCSGSSLWDYSTGMLIRAPEAEEPVWTLEAADHGDRNFQATQTKLGPLILIRVSDLASGILKVKRGYITVNEGQW